MRLKDKVTLVTGSGRGIGQAIALAFAREGADVVVNDVNPVDIEKTVKEVRALGRRSLGIEADISRASDIDKMVQKAVAEFKHVDILVNNAGVVDQVLALEMTEAQWDRVVDINLKGTVMVSQAVARQIVKQGKADYRIINIASIGGHIGIMRQVAYCATKAAVLGATRVLAVEWARYGINVNAVSPGITATEMMESTRRAHPEMLEGYINRIPRKRMARPEDIANAVLFLASPESEHITGHEIIVDGGTTVIHPGMINIE